MNLLLYFCVPLVVTGQVLVARSEEKGDNESEIIRNEESPETSETEMYSKYEYGSHIGYKNSPIDEFAVGQHGEYYRRPYAEDTGEVGKPGIYHTNSGNNDHPSFIASNIYNSIRDKKNGRGTKSNQLPSPLAYGVPAEEQTAALHHHQHDHNQHAHASHSPVVQQAPLVPLTSHQHVLVQDPHSGQLVQTPVYQNGLVPLYQSQLAPQLAYYGSGGAVAQKVLPTFKTAGVPLYHQQLVGKAVAPVHQQEVLLNTAYAPAYYQTPLLKTASPHTGHGEHVHTTPVLQPEISHHHHHHHSQLLKTHNHPVYQTHVFKSPVDALVYQKPLLKAHPAPVLKTEPVALYPHHQLNAGPLYQVPLLKGGEVAYGATYQTPFTAQGNPLLLKSPQLYQAPDVHLYPQTPLLLKDTIQPYQHPILQQNILHTGKGPLLQTPLLKTHNVEATIVPAIEEHASEYHYPAPVLKTHLKQPQLVHYLGPESALVAPKHPKLLLQKAISYKSPVLTEKAVLKAALSPVYGNPAVNIQKAIYKAPLQSHFVDHGGHFGPISPAAIFSSHKGVVDSLISSDAGKYHHHHGGKATGLFANAAHIELVPSLSYGYSYSLYPKASGVYGPPSHNHHHHHHPHK